MRSGPAGYRGVRMIGLAHIWLATPEGGDLLTAGTPRQHMQNKFRLTGIGCALWESHGRRTLSAAQCMMGRREPEVDGWSTGMAGALAGG